jgi:DNA-binding NarL/FixJ family response regulator
MTRIYLVEDHSIVREGIKALLLEEKDFEIVGESGDGNDALKNILSTKPDIVLMDVNVPGINGIQCAREIKKTDPQIKVLMLSMHDEHSYLTDVLNCGAEGFVIKNAKKNELVFAIRQVFAGGKYIAPEFTMNLLNRMRDGLTPYEVITTNIQISAKEQEVLNLMMEGLTSVQMAQKLFTSVRTIETRRKKLLDKTGTTNTATLVRFAIKSGLAK